MYKYFISFTIFVIILIFTQVNLNYVILYVLCFVNSKEIIIIIIVMINVNYIIVNVIGLILNQHINNLHWNWIYNIEMEVIMIIY